MAETTSDIASLVLRMVQERVSAWQNPKLVAISGPSCAGKTTLAMRLAEHARVVGHDVSVHHIDNFLYAEAERTRRLPEHIGYFEDAFDYGSFITEVHQDVAAKRADQSAGIVIAEGEFLLRSEYRSLWDFSVWIEVDEDLMLTRGVERDEAFFGVRDRAEAVYLLRLIPANRHHRKRDEPASHASLVLRSGVDGWTILSDGAALVPSEADE